MRQAIVTKYLGPTDHRGSRVLVKAQAGKLTIPWDDGLDVYENHLKAATAFAWKYGWLASGEIHGGALPSGTGYCFVIVPRKPLPEPRWNRED